MNTPNKNLAGLSPEELALRLEEQDTKLKKIAPKMKTTDQMLVHLMARRLELARRVAKSKHPAGSPTFRGQVEDDRLGNVTEWAIEEGINPNFPYSLLYLIMTESCKVQADMREKMLPFEKEDLSPKKLRQNLLLLTEKWAKIYDEQYVGRDHLGGIHSEFESSVLSELIKGMPRGSRDVLVDIGCATGRELFKHSAQFKKSVGFDVSPHMIAKAKLNLQEQKNGHVEFHIHDIEQNIPLPDNSVSCVYMNHGTASDISGINSIIRDMHRVLQPGGVFMLSFYNADALMYQSYLPWPPVLGAEVDSDDHCVQVRCGAEILPVYARAYSVAEAEALLPAHMILTKTLTHPTISSIVPKDVFVERKSLETMRTLDRILSNEGFGAYVILTGRRS